MIPNALFIGVQRSGTTWLHSILRDHPEVAVQRGHKESHFFNRRVLYEPLQSYLDGFGEQPADLGPEAMPPTVIADFSPAYSTLDRPLVERIARLLPQAKIVLILRNPVERCYSQAWLDYGFMRGNRKLDTLPVWKLVLHSERARVRRRTDYPRIIDNWRSVFGGDRMYVALHDTLQSDPRGFVHDILRFLELDTRWEPPEQNITRRTHAKTLSEMPEYVRWHLSRTWLSPTRQLNAMLSGAVQHWVEDMEQTVEAGKPMWPMRRAVFRHVLALPERLAYTAYDLRRKRRLDVAYRTKIDPAAPLHPGPIAAALRT